MTFQARGPALTVALGIFLAVCPRPALAQGSDALPTLDDSAPVTAPQPAPAAPQILFQTSAPLLLRAVTRPIRAQRRLALLGEVGWNGIAGFGPVLAFHLDPHVSLDLGAGVSAVGLKVGLRGRYNFLTGPVTPFVGVGAMAAGGFGEIAFSDENDRSREALHIRILPTAWLQTVAGVDWIAPGGFNLIGAGGYAWLLSHDPVEVVTGQPNAEERESFDVLFRSSIVFTVALGYSFR